MICPRCETASLIELDRQGLTIDRCDRCRGVWLDRGELEKLMARERAGVPEHAPAPEYDPRPRIDGEAPRAYRRPDSDDGEGPRRYRRADSDDGEERHHHGKRRSFWDLFD